MSGSNKIIVGAVAGVLVLCLMVGGIVALVKDDKVDNIDATSTTVSEPVTDEEGNTVVDSSSASSTTQVAEDLSQLILGKWTDSANMSGYEFFADGTVKMTYVNLDIPVINLPINGQANGTYTLEGDRLTTKFSIYSATIDKSYKVSVENNTLSMYDYEELETATYQKAASVDTTSVQGNTSPSASTGLEGAWINSAQTMKYSFENDGVIYVTVKNNDGSTTTYKGIYLKQEPSVVIQYSVDGETVTGNYTYTVSGNTLSLVDADGNINLFARSGGTSASSGGIIGTWRDGANMSGYTFKEGGIVDVTYVNFTVPVINMPINGTYTGSYTIDGNKITISYSIYGSSMVETYTYTVTDNALSFTSTSDGTVKSYVRQ